MKLTILLTITLVPWSCTSLKVMKSAPEVFTVKAISVAEEKENLNKLMKMVSGIIANAPMTLAEIKHQKGLVMKIAKQVDETLQHSTLHRMTRRLGRNLVG